MEKEIIQLILKYNDDEKKFISECVKFLEKNQKNKEDKIIKILSNAIDREILAKVFWLKKDIYIRIEKLKRIIN